MPVAFKGGPEATIEILGGRAHYHVGTMGVVLPFVREGKLVALAVTTPQRASVLPDVPALGETMPEFKRPETSHAVLAPAGTPRPIVDRLNADTHKALQAPAVRQRLEDMGGEARGSTPDEMKAMVTRELEKWTRVVAESQIPRQ